MTNGRFNFVRFTDTGKSFNARATIRSNGQIGFTEGARNLFGLHNYTHVVLFFDSDQLAVGFKFTNDAQEPGAMPFKADPKNSYVNASGFLDKNGVSYKRSSRYPLEKIDDMVVMVLGAGEQAEDEKEENRDEVDQNLATEIRP